jgi:hypothetical protein
MFDFLFLLKNQNSNTLNICLAKFYIPFSILEYMIDHILKNHELTLSDVKHVFYCNGKSDTLFISFAGKIDKYVSVTWFYNQNDFVGNFLFLKNDENYNTYNEEKYHNLIQYYVSGLNIREVITYGPSMGGIASIYYGLKFNASLMISIDPNPINFDYNILLNEIRNSIHNYDYKNKIYINYTFINDFHTLPEWTEKIINELKLKNVILTLQPFRSIEHLQFIPSKEYLMEIINANKMLKVKNYTNTATWV